MIDDMMNKEEVCNFLGISKNQLVYLTNTKRLPKCNKKFKWIRYKRSDVLEYLHKYVVMKDWEV